MVAGSAVAGRIDGPHSQSLPQGISKQDVDERFQQLAFMFELASGDTKVDSLHLLAHSFPLQRQKERRYVE